jgi:hypothetical protein
MNAAVGNTSAAPISPGLVVQAVGPIQGVAPAATRNQPQQQHTAQGEGALNLPLAVYLIPVQGPVDK